MRSSMRRSEQGVAEEISTVSFSEAAAMKTKAIGLFLASWKRRGGHAHMRVYYPSNFTKLTLFFRAHTNARPLSASVIVCASLKGYFLVVNPYSGPSIVWDKMVPLKLRCFIWRGSLYRIPIVTSLVERGITISIHLYKFCNTGPETADHLLLNCEFARGVCKWIFKWRGINTQHFSNIRECIDLQHPGGIIQGKEQSLFLGCPTYPVRPFWGADLPGAAILGCRPTHVKPFWGADLPMSSHSRVLTYPSVLTTDPRRLFHPYC
uniref:Reverse transcriptase zinc-binding domain-containing protein n=1 Tax=Lactuca sativa TaxID=4236 RepID=A0A9R1V224_LACSA|nr:hypothetical protein LSAT_V11C700380990 [Lactuca sativa]